MNNIRILQKPHISFPKQIHVNKLQMRCYESNWVKKQGSIWKNAFLGNLR